MKFDVVIPDCDTVIEGKRQTATLAISNGKISAINPASGWEAKRTLKTTGLTCLPGVIDSQVHFRDPGLTEKEDFESGTRAALKGGVTAILDMPNTLPPTTTPQAYLEKLETVRPKAWTHFGLFAGAIKGNAEDLTQIEKLPACVGVKIFMGKSTGGLLLCHEEELKEALSRVSKRVAVHCEDEDLLEELKLKIPENATSAHHPVWRNEETAIRATTRLLKVAIETKQPVHILHITTKQEMELLRNRPSFVTTEVTPQHLFFASPDCYEQLGSRVQMNPPIRSKDHREALWKALLDGTVDVIGSDHAPHLLSEKSKPYPNCPSGMPGVQTLLPILLNWVSKDKLSLERVVELICSKPAEIYSFKNKGTIKVGADADLTFVDLNESRTIEDSWIESRCKWTPYDGVQVKGWPKGVLLCGETAMWDEEVLEGPLGKPLEYI